MGLTLARLTTLSLLTLVTSLRCLGEFPPQALQFREQLCRWVRLGLEALSGLPRRQRQGPLGAPLQVVQRGRRDTFQRGCFECLTVANALGRITEPRYRL